MAFGILEDHKLDSVPGTGLLSSKANQVTTDEARELKRGTGKYSHIVLIPQPSDDPRDPLNWPRWKKEACFWTLMFLSALADSLALLPTSGYFVLAKEFNVSVDEVASSFSTCFAGTAVFTLLQIPIGVKYGHRMIYLLSTFVMLMSCLWTALSTNMTSIRASRIFQGSGMAATRCFVASTIEHLYFVHERGSRLCIWNVFQTAGPLLGSLINSYVIQLMSWRLGFWFVSIVCGLSFFGVFFLVPETTYHRPASPIHSMSTKLQQPASDKDSIEKICRASASADHVDPNTSSTSPDPPTILSQLNIYNGTFSNESIWKIFLRPFPFILSPVTWFTLFTYIISTECLGFVVACSSTIFSVTYGFNAGQIGLTNIGSIIGMFLAMVIIGPLNDWWIVWMSRRNRGIYEPEYRLFFTFGMVIGGFGYVGWAIGNDHHMPWIGAVACLSIAYFSIIITGAMRAAYVIDVHGANASHVLTLTEFALNAIAYGSTFFANGLILSAGVRRTLLALGACQIVCTLACVPMYVFGKRARSFIARHPRLFQGDLPTSDVQAQRAASTGTDPKC